MKVSLNFLKSYIDINVSVEKLSELLTLHTAEVENIEKFADHFRRVFVGKILEIEKHPRARNLHIAQVDVGFQKVQLVFGKMFPVRKGECLPVVIAPAVLPTGIKIERVKLGGVVSDGMITSDEELGLPLTDEGLMRFGKNVKPGTSLCKALGLEDIVFDIDILPNRAPDLLSHFGIAREIAALTGGKVTEPQIRIKEEDKNAADLIKVRVQDRRLCSRYIARIIEDVKVKESPAWIRNYLIAAGVRPINNVVDITNFVMLELGEPLHAFDYKKLQGKGDKKTIIVRQAKRGEQLYTLDGKRRKLPKEALLIADEKKGIAIAGVMGGRNSEVSSRTKTVVLEAANFDPLSIRRTSRKLNLKTEASMRFEKGLDPNLAQIAIDRAAFLLQEIANGKVLSGRVDFYPRQVRPKNLLLDEAYLNKFLGIEIKKQEIIDILKSLSFEVKEKKKGILAVKVPTFRLDINIPEDLIEEVARIYGYNRIKSIPPKAELTAELPNEFLNLRRQIKSVLKELSFTEVYNYSFQSAASFKKLGLKEKDHLELLNPLDKEVRFLRISIFPGLFVNLKKNLKNFEAFRIFEIGRVYLSKGFDKLPQEKYILSGLLLGESESFYTTKGVIEALFEGLSISLENKNLRVISKDLEEPYFGPRSWHPGKAAEVFFGRKRVGVFGCFNPKLLDKIGIKEQVFGFSLDLDLIFKQERIQTVFEPLPKYPEVRRDLAVIVRKDILTEDVCNVIQKAGGKVVQDIDLFDMYESEKIGINKKSLAFHIAYRLETHTLSDKEVSAIEEKIEKALENQLNAEIRKK